MRMYYNLLHRIILNRRAEWIIAMVIAAVQIRTVAGCISRGGQSPWKTELDKSTKLTSAEKKAYTLGQWFSYCYSTTSIKYHTHHTIIILYVYILLLVEPYDRRA